MKSKAAKAVRREAAPIEKEKGLFKANGAKIKNPSAYVANFDSQGHREPLFNAHGEEIKNPVAYVAKMMQNESRQTKKVLVPQTRGKKVTYYSKLGKGSQTDIIAQMHAQLSSMRARASQLERSIGGAVTRRPARR